MKNEKLARMPIINSDAAGIDIGSKSHYVAVGERQQDVAEFGVYSKDHQAMIRFLKAHRITTVAMESTGSYWQTLFTALQDAGLEVLLVSGHQTKNLRAKTDVKDCIWIQKLHSLGLLRGCFLPDQDTARLRVLQRHRSSLIEESSKMVNKMQKALRMMNLRLDVVINDITGKSGMAIINAILEGEREGKALSQLTDPRIKRSRKEVADALQGHWSEELLYELEDCHQIYSLLQFRLKACDKRLEALLNEFTKDIRLDGQQIHLTKKQTKGKNQPKFNLSELSFKFYGVDLFAIESISSSTVLTLICEIGYGIYKFQSAKQFTSFLRLAHVAALGDVACSRRAMTDTGSSRKSPDIPCLSDSVGTHSDGANRKATPLKPRRATPMIMCGSRFTATVVPSTDGSLAKSEAHRS